MKKKTQKTIFIISCVVIFVCFFGFNTPAAKAITIEELKAQIAAIQRQITQLQKQLAEIQSSQIQKTEELKTAVKEKIQNITKLEYRADYNKQNKRAKIHLDVTLPKYRLIQQDNWTVLECEDEDLFSFAEKGEPGLLFFEYFISIPRGAEVEKITVNPTKKNIGLSQSLKPIPEPIMFGGSLKLLVPDEAIYNSLKVYPEKDFDYSLAKQGSTALLVLKFYPFKYTGKTKTLTVYDYTSIDIVLKTNTWVSNSAPRNAVDKDLKSKLVNPDSAFFFGTGNR